MKRAKEDGIEGFEQYVDESNNQKESTLNNTNTLSKKRVRENENGNESTKTNENILLYNPEEEDSENEIKEDSSSSSEEEIPFDENFFDKVDGEDEERLEGFYDISDNRKEIK